jgi:hypothetical protein
MFRVICIDDTKRPVNIVPSNWVKKDKIYTVIEVYKGVLDNREGYVLEEINPNNNMHAGYASFRFKPVDELPDDALAELLEESFSILI